MDIAMVIIVCVGLTASFLFLRFALGLRSVLMEAHGVGIEDFYDMARPIEPDIDSAPADAFDPPEDWNSQMWTASPKFWPLGGDVTFATLMSGFEGSSFEVFQLTPQLDEIPEEFVQWSPVGEPYKLVGGTIRLFVDPTQSELRRSEH